MYPILNIVKYFGEHFVIILLSFLVNVLEYFFNVLVLFVKWESYDRKRRILASLLYKTFVAQLFLFILKMKQEVTYTYTYVFGLWIKRLKLRFKKFAHGFGVGTNRPSPVLTSSFNRLLPPRSFSLNLLIIVDSFFFFQILFSSSYLKRITTFQYCLIIT